MGIEVIGSAPAGGKVPQVEKFTSSGTWTAPDGVELVKVFLVGGGGGGASSDSNNSYHSIGGSGGGGEVLEEWLSVTPGQSYTITVGAGGSAPNTLRQNGTHGNPSSFGNLLTARGGGRGLYSNKSEPPVNVASAGSYGADSNQPTASGGAGGAGGPGLNDAYSTSYNLNVFRPSVPRGNSAATRSSFNGARFYTGIAGSGIKGYGGGGGSSIASTTNDIQASGAPDGGGRGAVSGGSNKVVSSLPGETNKGGGGGGASRAENGNYVAPSSGGSGYCELFYYN